LWFHKKVHTPRYSPKPLMHVKNLTSNPLMVEYFYGHFALIIYLRVIHFGRWWITLFL
jgi:hypothetical protein